MTKRTVRVTFSGECTFDIDDTSDDFELYYSASTVDGVDIETVREIDGKTPYLIEYILEDPDSFTFELNWADEAD